ALAAMLLIEAPLLAQRASPVPRPTVVRVGVVVDGPTGREMFPTDVIEQEARNVLGTDLQILLPADKRFTGDWSNAGVNAALDRALADRGVEIVLTLGILASHEAAHRATLPKPTIAATVIDPVLQKFPLAQGVSGRRNFTYIADFQSVGNE